MKFIVFIVIAPPEVIQNTIVVEMLTSLVKKWTATAIRTKSPKTFSMKDKR